MFPMDERARRNCTVIVQFDKPTRNGIFRRTRKFHSASKAKTFFVACDRDGLNPKIKSAAVS